MLRLKACERCRGDLVLESDLGTYTAWVCMQCGYEQETNGEPEVCRPPRQQFLWKARGRKVPTRYGAR